MTDSFKPQIIPLATYPLAVHHDTLSSSKERLQRDLLEREATIRQLQNQVNHLLSSSSTAVVFNRERNNSASSSDSKYRRRFPSIGSFLMSMGKRLSARPRQNSDRSGSVSESTYSPLSSPEPTVKEDLELSAIIVDFDGVVGPVDMHSPKPAVRSRTGTTGSCPRHTNIMATMSFVDLTELHHQLYRSASCWDLANGPEVQRRRSSVNPLATSLKSEYSYAELLQQNSNNLDLDNLEEYLDNDSCLLVFGCPKVLMPMLKPEVREEKKRRWLLSRILFLGNEKMKY